MNHSTDIQRVFLTGYMGSGKSFIGQFLAKRLGIEYVDSDNIISRKESLTITDIFETKGEDYFRAQEYETVTKLCSEEKNAVIALGGGAFVQQKINEYLLADKKSIVVYLKFDTKHLISRLETEKEGRPLIAKQKNLDVFIDKHLNERSPWYEKAHLTIINEEDVNIVINQILTYLKYTNQKLSTI